MQIDELVRSIEPKRSVLFLGSGTSIGSGGLTGAMLADALWSDLVGGDRVSSDLAEVAGILCNRPEIGRKKLIERLRDRLSTLDATAAMRALVSHPWSAIYTTNYDYVIERACKAISKPISLVRSNFDYSQLEASDHLPVLKLHGCLSQDIVDGHHGRIVITEEDYELAANYREILYDRLALELATKDVIIVGHSLKDADVKKEVTKAAELKRNRAAPGRIILVSYERDDDRAQLLERRSISVCTATLEQLTEAFARRDESGSIPLSAPADELLTHRQAACTIFVGEECRKPSNPARLFHGGEAAYGDIEKGLTFSRTQEDHLIDPLIHGSKKFLLWSPA